MREDKKKEIERTNRWNVHILILSFTHWFFPLAVVDARGINNFKNPHMVLSRKQDIGHCLCN